MTTIFYFQIKNKFHTKYKEMGESLKIILNEDKDITFFDEANKKIQNFKNLQCKYLKKKK